MADSADPAQWLLPPASEAAAGTCGIWGRGTDMARRAVPWDGHSVVTPLIGGFETMESISASFERAIGEARLSGAPPGKRGYVYVAAWRLDPLRDLSSKNPWGTRPWDEADAATTDQTVIGSFLRLLEAGVTVRVLLWMPHWLQSHAALTRQVVEGHRYLFSFLQRKSEALEANGFPPGLGVVALDTRVGAFAGAHHQKLIIVRGAGTTHVAYCGGIDLAFTRRDAPDASSIDTPAFGVGDWQSGASLPGGRAPWFGSARWPREADVAYPSISADVIPDDSALRPDLPAGAYGPTNQLWHDQHVRLEGDIVVTLERNFGERWTDPAPGRYGRVRTLGRRDVLRSNAAYVSHACVLAEGSTLAPLPEPVAVPPITEGATSLVQIWRTVPVRRRGAKPSLFERGEFSNLAGVARACERAGQLIWIFDQYFWSVALSRLLAKALTDPARPGLHVVVILPAYPDAHEVAALAARRRSFAELSAHLTSTQLERVRIYDLWHPKQARGIYAHAKVQLFDGALLVCGSCNMNRRSFSCDTELTCAVLDKSVVSRHQERLWHLLFPHAAALDVQMGGSIDLDVPGSGKRFFEALRTAATPESFVVEDPDFNVGGRPPDRAMLPPSGWPDRPSTLHTPLRNVTRFLLDPTSLSAGFPAGSDLSHIAAYLGEDSDVRPRYRK